MTSKIINSAEEMAVFAKEYLSIIEKTDNQNADTATVIALSGDLGAGKTTFVQGIAKELKAEGRVISPTFIIERIHALNHKKWEKMVHIDAYRLNNQEEMSALKWSDLIDDAGNIIFIEWPEKVDGAIPENAYKIRFKHLEGDKREVNY
jgi:tRNA threonylcarbamoyladenosine biosynthesis protein TsaE